MLNNIERCKNEKPSLMNKLGCLFVMKLRIKNNYTIIY